MDTLSKDYLVRHLLKAKKKVLLDLSTGIIYTPDDIEEMNQEYFYIRLGAGSKHK